MNKLAGATLVGIAGLVLGVLAWQAGKSSASEERDPLQLMRSTSWDYDTVRECVKSGNGSYIFQNFEQVFSFGSYEPPDASTYQDRSGSSLVIERVSGRTEVRLKSARPLSDEQADLLNWCILNPQLTWIAPEFRSK
ncbi:MAG: hypothetical protein V2I43_00360 [Parvularcula sp.]|jgi:hypothetical protein|nr:hypothetical protein [Parvularcula sp.]